jgi:tubulin alpha
MSSWENKTVAVTGANSGIGLELTRQYSAQGASVIALVRRTNAKLDAIPRVTLVTGVDVSQDTVGEIIAKALEGKQIDVLINCAGGIGGPRSANPNDMFAAQDLAHVTTDHMLWCFQLNTLGPMRVSKACLPLMTSESKIIIISSLVGSITDNTSGGAYAYRASKAAVNMVGMSLAQDLKSRGIAVGMVHPGNVLTNAFTDDDSKKPEGMAYLKTADVAVEGVRQAIDAITIENTGAFLHGNYGQGLKTCPW